MSALNAPARNPIGPDHHFHTLLTGTAQIDRILIQLAQQLTTLTPQTLLELAVLKRLGCDQMQGFLLSPALPPDGAGELARARGLALTFS